MQLLAPATGDVLRLEDLSHPLLKSGMLGTGAAVVMTTGEVIAPVSGEISNINVAKAQMQIVHPKGLKVLIQIGQPGDILYGERLRWLVKKGQKCKAGTPLLQSDPLWIKQQGGSPLCIVTLLNGASLSAIVLTTDPKVRLRDSRFLTLFV